MPSTTNYAISLCLFSDLSEVEDQQFKHKPLYLPRFYLPRFRILRRAFRFCRPLYVFPLIFLFATWQLIYNGSYDNPKPFQINREETVYIAANIVNGDLIRGDWGNSLKGLVELIGEERVYVSIYGGPKDALLELARGLNCEKRIVPQEDDPIDMTSIPKTILPTGERLIKRIAYLAQVRNRALEPLQTLDRKFDKLLFINDVFFDPMDAARVLWGTNINKEGKAEYKAVCAVDFMLSWKYYDTYATRDAEGYSMGAQIFPWFGEGVSRRDVLEGRDAVRVKSCWGGMVAFDARYFQYSEQHEADAIGIRENDDGNRTVPTLPLRFRSERELTWDASECCLIHADILALPPLTPPSTSRTDKYDSGIYLNPFVRVSYDKTSWRNINTTKRFERLFVLPQRIINKLLSMPDFNPRRLEVEGEIIKDRRWVSLTPTSVPYVDGPPSENRNDNRFHGSTAESMWQGSGFNKRNKTSKPKGKEDRKSVV